MTDKPISPLRQRMIEDMTARHFAEKAQTDYIRYVKSFAAFLGRSPDAATAEDLRLFQLHMAKTHVSPWTINATIVALRFFFKVTLGNRQTRVAAHATPQLRNSSARTERRCQGHPSPAQNSHILLVNRIARGRYTIGSIPNAVRPCLFSGNSPAGELIWSPFRNRMGPSHAFPRG